MKWPIAVKPCNTPNHQSVRVNQSLCNILTSLFGNNICWQGWERPYTLMKARQLYDQTHADAVIAKTRPLYLKERVERGQVLSRVEVGLAALDGIDVQEEDVALVRYVMEEMKGELCVELVLMMGRTGEV